MKRTSLLRASALAAGLLAPSLAGTASAQSTIRHPGDRVPYKVELEPHLTLGAFTPPGDGSGTGIGAGFRASFEIVHDGFVKSLNDSVAIGVGADFLHYGGTGTVNPGTCARFVTGPDGMPLCVEVHQRGGPSNYAFFPVVMQWNFFLTRKWSVFGEPGLSLYWFDYRTVSATPVLDLGGRFHFNDRVTLTMRLGYPAFTIGVSFLL